jgi:hypothetical protein
MENRLEISIIAFDELTIDRASGACTGSHSGWRVKAVVNGTYLLLDQEYADERDVRASLYRIADNHLPKIGPA